MSPVSRGRKPKKKTAKNKPAALSAELREHFDNTLTDFEEVAGSDDVLDVELLASELIGSFWLAGYPDDAEREVAFPLIAYAAAKQSPAALGVLRGLQALGVTEEMRARAGAAADRLVTLGMREPPWADGLRAVTVTGCWQQADVYGDNAVLLFECDRGGRRHGLVAEIDRYAGVDEIYLTTEVDQVLAELREHADAEILETGQLSLARGRRILEDAVATNNDLAILLPDPIEQDPLSEARAFTLARLRAMPEAEPADEPESYSDAECEAIVRQFLAEAKGIEDNADTLRYASTIVEFGRSADEHRPLKVSPARFEFFFEELLRTGDAEEDKVDLLHDVALAWAGWQGRRDGLRPAAIDHLRAEVEAIFADFRTDLAEDGEDEGDIPIALRGE
jgi:hypothetical protein